MFSTLGIETARQWRLISVQFVFFHSSIRKNGEIWQKYVVVLNKLSTESKDFAEISINCSSPNVETIPAFICQVFPRHTMLYIGVRSLMFFYFLLLEKRSSIFICCSISRIIVRNSGVIKISRKTFETNSRYSQKFQFFVND